MSQTLQIMKMGEQIADLEDQITKWKEDYICLENLKDYQIEQLREHHKKVYDDFTFIHITLEEKIKELEKQIEKMKCCNNCEYKNYNWSFQPICTVRENDDRDIENPVTCKCKYWKLKEN